VKLLVSILGADEVSEAISGGADIIDVKNPKEGSLGAAAPWIVREVLDAVGPRRETSCAIGDLPNLPGTASLAAAGAAALSPNYLKLGLLGTRSHNDATALLGSVVRATRSVSPSVKVIACSYADWKLVGCVCPLDLPRIASSAHADGVLIDTINKDGRSLFDFLSLPDLTHFVREARRSGLVSGLAGSLRENQADSIASCDPDVVGIRTAACSRGNRILGKVSATRIRAFKAHLA
jgi:uncharacterized protein (UPF0264 family)